MRSDAFGCVWMRSDAFEHFRKNSENFVEKIVFSPPSVLGLLDFSLVPPRPKSVPACVRQPLLLEFALSCFYAPADVHGPVLLPPSSTRNRKATSALRALSLIHI